MSDDEEKEGVILTASTPVFPVAYGPRSLAILLVVWIPSSLFPVNKTNHSSRRSRRDDDVTLMKV
jgi:hypothetical protein